MSQEADQLKQLGEECYYQYRFAEAEGFFLQALDIYTNLQATDDMAISLLYIAEINGMQSNYPQAEDYYSQASTIYQAVGNQNGQAHCLKGLAQINYMQDNNPQAEQYYSQAQTIYQAVGNQNGQAHCLKGLAQINRRQSNYPQAEQYYSQAQTIYQAVSNQNGQAHCLKGLAQINRRQSNYPQAEDYYSQASTIYQAVGNQNGQAHCLKGLAQINYMQDNNPQAEQYYSQAQTIYQAVGNQNGQAHCLKGLAQINRRQSNNPQAEQYYSQASTIYQSIGAIYSYYFVSVRLGDLYSKQEPQQQKAINSYEQALEALETLCSYQITPADKQKQRETALEVYENLVEAYIKANNLAKAVETIERSKSRNLVELFANRENTPKNTPSELIAKLKELKQQLQTIQKQQTSATQPNSTLDNQSRSFPIPSSKTDLEELEQRKKNLQQQLQTLLEEIKRYDPAFIFTQTVKIITLSEIQQLLNEKTVLLEWYLGKEYLYTFIITKTTIDYLRFSNLDDLREFTNKYLNSYKTDYLQWLNQLEDNLQKLSEKLHIKEIIAKIDLTQYKQLRLIPYRELHLFPLHVLPLDAQCLLEKFEQGVSYFPSCQLWQLATEKNHSHKPSSLGEQNLFAIQNPTEDLRYANIEVDGILTSFTGYKHCLQDKKATRGEFLNNQDQLSQAFIWHNACHSYFNFEEPVKSGLCLANSLVTVLETTDDRYQPWREGRNLDSEAILSIIDLFNLDLQKCFLTVISSCESGLTVLDPKLEEYIGLSSALIYSGVSYIVPSLWRVNDASTAILMIKLYQNLLASGTLNVSLALNKAQIWLKNLTRGAFIKWLKILPSPVQEALKGVKDDYHNDELIFPQLQYWAAFVSIG